MKFSTCANGFGQKDITARDWDHALVRLEYAVAVGLLPPGTEISGELIERTHCDDDIVDAMNPVGRIT